MKWSLRSTKFRPSWQLSFRKLFVRRVKGGDQSCARALEEGIGCIRSRRQGSDSNWQRSAAVQAQAAPKVVVGILCPRG